MGISYSIRPRPLFFGVGFYVMGLGKPQQHANKIEVASFTGCRNIIGEPPNFGELSKPKATHTQFSHGCNFMMDPGKPKLCTKFQVTSLAIV